MIPKRTQKFISANVVPFYTVFDILAYEGIPSQSFMFDDRCGIMQQARDVIWSRLACPGADTDLWKGRKRPMILQRT